MKLSNVMVLCLVGYWKIQGISAFLYQQKTDRTEFYLPKRTRELWEHCNCEYSVAQRILPKFLRTAFLILVNLVAHMRWIWIDKFIEFRRGESAKAIKNITLAEEHLHDHFPGSPLMPNSLITEGIAQTGGLLVGESEKFQKRVVLAKIPKAIYHLPALPGNVLTYTVTIERLTEEGAMISGTSHIGDQLQAELEIVYAYISDEIVGESLFQPTDFLDQMRAFGLFDQLAKEYQLDWSSYVPS